jgi:Tfp pilus assembly protein PilX
MKTKLLVIGLLVTLAAGCDTVTKKEFTELQNRVTANEKAAADAMAAARAAQGGNTQGIANAQATADKALAAAQEASERAKRVSETCCTRK